MRLRTNNQRYLLWLALGTAAMALAVASLLVFELAQRRAIDQSSAIRSDSTTALVFQFEREYLRLREALVGAVSAREAPDLDTLSLRYDIFLSRLTLLRDSPSVALLASRDEYRRVVPALDPLVAQMDQAMASTPVNRAALAHVLAQMNDLGAAVQSLTLAADSEMARLLERQSDTMREQNALVVWLTLAQLVILMTASGALVVRQRRLERERQALEQMTHDLRDAQLRAEAANRGKSQFLANMSHELRTPFNGLMGMLTLLQGTPVTPQQADYVETAQASAKHLLTLLNDILDLSALESGKLTLKPQALHLSQLLTDVRALMRPLALGKGLSFHMSAPAVDWPWVLADETRLKQILFNLISNAIKFTPAGQVSLEIREHARSGNRLELAFDIQDTGIGMDEAVLSRLFQRFYQVDDSSTRRFGGTGLGLEISQSLARMMGGEISVRSTVGVGSLFTVVLGFPIADAPLPEAVADGVPQAKALADAPAAPRAPAEPAADALGLRVLVVEDHPVNQKLVGVLLGRMGCVVTFCENGQLAFEQVQRDAFDLVLMDVNMPVMDGLSATRLIRALPGEVAQIPIVIFTADVMNEAREQALAAGANDFLSKPVKVDQLRALALHYARQTQTE